MTDSTALGAHAETLAGIYEQLLADLPPTHAAERVLDGLFQSIEAIDTLVDGRVGHQARGVLGLTEH